MSAVLSGLQSPWICMVLGLVAFATFASPLGATRYVVDGSHSKASDDGPGTPEKPFKTISAAVAKLKAGDTVSVKEGVYRENVKINVSGEKGRPVVLEAADGEQVVVSGADLVDGWVEAGIKTGKAAGKPLWKKAPWKPWKRYGTNTKGRGPGPMLIVDNMQYRHVGTVEDMFPGSFCYHPDGDGAIYLWLYPPRGGEFQVEEKADWWDNPVDLTSDDPNKHQVEVAVRTYNIGASYRSYVVIRGITVRHNVAYAQHPALYIESDFKKGKISRHCTIENCVVEFVHGRGMTTSGDNLTVRGCYVRYCGASGAGGQMTNSLWEDNVLDGNTTMGHSHGWEAGGVKFVRSCNLTVRRCQFVNNDGPGLWFDWGHSGILVEQCFCSFNSGSGIMMEVSPHFESEKPSARAIIDEIDAPTMGVKKGADAAPSIIRNNICVGNRWDGFLGSGILLQMASNNIVVNNTCVDNEMFGIFVRYHPYDKHWHRCVDNVILNNLLVDNGGSQVYINPDPVDKPGYVARNRSDYNLFWSTKAWLNRRQSTQEKEYGWNRSSFSRWGKSMINGTYSAEEWFKIRGYDEHSIQWDPMFVSRSMLDFRLRPDSPAIGAGIPSKHVEHDYLGRARPVGRPPSIGALEYFPVSQGKTKLPLR